MAKGLLKKMCELERDQAFPFALAKNLAMLVLDVDGVLTDGGLYYNDQGLACKRFDVQDGLGIKLAQRAGIEVVIISGMLSEALQKRAKDLAIEECHTGCLHKLEKLQEIMRARGLDWAQLACIGDDLIDLPVLSRVGLAVAVRNAQPEVRAAAHYVTPQKGGHGAVRGVIRHILLARGSLEGLLADFIA